MCLSLVLQLGHLQVCSAPATGIVGATVDIDFFGHPDLAICLAQLDPLVTVTCNATTKRVSKDTGMGGFVTFTILGGSNGAGNAVTLNNGALVSVGGVPIGLSNGIASVATFDIDGANGVGINDLSVWLTDFGTLGNPAFGRSDYDCSGSIGINDLSIWLGVFGGAGSASSCAGSCL